MNNKVKIAEYGSWSSPITSDLVGDDGMPFSTFSEVHTCLNAENQETVFWSESRSNEDGRIVVCSKTTGQPIVDWTPKGYNARTTVHEYGGGATFVHNNQVYFSNFDDQRLYKQESPNSVPQAITPDSKRWRFADGEMVAFLNKIVCIREDHDPEDDVPKKVQNLIVSIDPITQEQHVLVEGADFYASPRVSSTGMLAWVQWNHPNMPWDTVGLWTGQLDTSGKCLVPNTVKQIMYDEDVSIMTPRWNKDDSLYFITDKSDWWNLYEYIASTEEERNLFPVEKEVGLPHWVFAQCAYCPHPKIPTKIVGIYNGKLGMIDTDQEKFQEIDTGFDFHSYPKFSSSGDKIFVCASSSLKDTCLIQVNIESHNVEVIKGGPVIEIDPGYISEPETITFPTEDNKVAHAFLYLPKNKDYAAPSGTLPPLLIRAHGGPTASTSSSFDVGKQFFTSRGVAICDVNYRGSTGYGMHYRNELYGKWGIVDVDDCCNVALHVANTLKKADRNKLCIDGGSAGGFTTLACLTMRNDVFKAGASKYGVSDLKALATDTHKFESCYIDTLVGSGPGMEQRYKDRSPINSANNLNCPMVFFQGAEDKIVLPNQAEKMFKIVKEKGLMCAYVLFEGEQHGFRKKENIIKTLAGEFCFFAKVFGYESADFKNELDIHNVKE